MKAIGLTLNDSEVKFEPTSEVLPIAFYLLHALWDFVNGEVSSGKLKPTFVTSRIFLMQSDTTFIGFRISDASAMMLVKSSAKMAVSRARWSLEGDPLGRSCSCVPPSEGVPAEGSSAGLEGASTGGSSTGSEKQEKQPSTGLEQQQLI